eukprot:Platyproteum_vivax@DN2867_c0_g1_i1.p2
MPNYANVGKAAYRQAASHFGGSYRSCMASAVCKFQRSSALMCNPVTLRMESMTTSSTSHEVASVFFPDSDGAANEDDSSILLGVMDNIMSIQTSSISGSHLLSRCG